MEQATLMELGLLPIVTSAFLWQILGSASVIKVNFAYSQDRELFQSAQKLTSFFLAAVFGISLIASGYYDKVVRGSDDTSSLGWYLLIFMQIFGWNALLTLIVEILDKGYGFGSGVLSFLALNAATRLVRDVVGVEMVSASPEGEPETYGVVTFFVKALLSMNFSNIKDALVGIFFRPGFPSIETVLIAVAAGLTTIILLNYRVELPIRSSRARGTANVYPIRMLYDGSLPVLYAFTVVANAQITLHFLSVAFLAISPMAAALAGAHGENGAAIGGLSFYLSPPTSLIDSLLSPIRAVTFTSLIVVLAVWFASFWCKVSGSAPKDISRQFKEQSIVIAGKRDVSITKELSKVIPTAATTGAFALATVALIGEMSGTRGRTASVVIGLSASFAILEEFMLELQQSGSGSQLINSLAKR